MDPHLHRAPTTLFPVLAPQATDRPDGAPSGGGGRRPGDAAAPRPDVDPLHSRARRAVRGLGALLVVAAAALVLGGLTSWGQTLLPAPLAPAANSIGGWTIVAFALVWLVRARPAWAAVLGIVAFQGLNEGYGLVSAARGWFYAEPFSSVWTLAGLVAGPVVGAAAALARHGGPALRTSGVGVLAAVLVADGTTSLARVAATTGATWWLIEIAAGAVALTLVLAHERPRPAVAVAVVAAVAAGATAFGAVTGSTIA